MGTVLKVLGVVLLLIVVGIAGLFYCAHDKGASVQEDFFADVLSGDVARLRARLHSSVNEEIDDPVLAAWMAAVKEHLGTFEGMAGSDFSTNMKVENGVSTVESKGTVKFEKGEARSALKTMDGKIVAFEVTSDALPDNWFTTLDDVSLYDARGRTFLTTLLAGDADGALALMHEKLRAKFKPEEFAAGLAQMQADFGALQSAQLGEHTFAAGPPQELVLAYAVTTAKGETTGYVRFQFNGMRGHLVGFGVPDKR